MRRLLTEHLPASLFVGIIGYGWTGDWLCVPIALLAGWLIDADHLIDFAYYIVRHHRNVDYRLLQNGGYFKANGRVFVPLHSWELTLLILVGGAAMGELVLGTVGAIAHGAHLFQDQHRYRVRALGYLLTSRLLSRFTLKGFCASS